MNFDKKVISPDSNQNKLGNQDLKILNEQLKEAISSEDYEQAAVLRDLIASNQEVSISEKELDEPSRRALEGIEEKRQINFWQGKELVDSSEFSEHLDYYLEDTFSESLNDEIKNMEQNQGLEKVDCLLNLYNKREEAKKIVNLSEERFNYIWQPYEEKVGLPDMEYNDCKTLYKERIISSLPNEDREKIIKNILTPLNYWQGIYINSKMILNRLNEVISEMESKPMRY